ncbi:uncharacterized protein LOC121424045 isoform X2 [Lytechinus variegatus]|uniref:uncharacterized protein LOC121424045 isoform X2 n=1 Tax=Lytechinus variegatus TaxID=7654 RepID=UPI001BB14120|nr:uncharacterized protein LOC121424045 isoform X2 [Lytechinus variegatus]
MAAPLGSISVRLSTANFTCKRRENRPAITKSAEGTTSDLLSTEKCTENSKTKQEIACVPVIVEFRRLLESVKYKSIDVVPGISNVELLHTVVGLYDTCLPDITPQVLYSTVTGKWAKTLVLLRSRKDVALELQKRILQREREIEQNTAQKGTISQNNNANVNKDSSITSDDPTKTTNSDADLDPSVTNDSGETKESPLLRLLEIGGDGEATNVIQNSKGANSQPGGERDDANDAVAKEEVDCVAKEDEDSVAKEDLEDVLEEEEQRKVFADVFSDSDSEEEESEEEEEEKDFSKGIHEFLRAVKQRKERREELSLNPTLEEIESTVGIESRIVACATWEKSHIRPGEKIVQIDLMGVRKRCRRCGIGRYLLRQMKDVSIVGPYDSLVVYADHSAVDFFALHGFSDDIVLNSKYSDLADNWTNCTLMCYIPPFVGQTILKETDMTLDLKELEMELQKWTEKSRDAYQGQVSCIMRLRHEVIALRALVSSQKDLISSLTEELESTQTDKLMIEKSFLEHRIAAIKAGYYERHYGDGPSNGTAKESQTENHYTTGTDGDDEAEDESDDDGEDEEDGEDDEEDDHDGDVDEEEEIDTETLIKALEAEARNLKGRRQSFDIGGLVEQREIAERFESEMIDNPRPGARCHVTKVTMASLSSALRELYQLRLNQLGDPSIFTELYYCGSLHHPERINKIMSNGFSDEDLTYGEYGVGLYFSSHPGTAAHFSALGKMILVEAGLGRTESVIKKDRFRLTAPVGFDSIVTPGRLSAMSPSGGDGAHDLTAPSKCNEYVIFDHLQVKPICLIEYTTSQASVKSVRL